MPLDIHTVKALKASSGVRRRPEPAQLVLSWIWTVPGLFDNWADYTLPHRTTFGSTSAVLKKLQDCLEMPININKHQDLKPMFRALVALDKAEKAMDSFQMWRQLLDVHLLKGDWEWCLQQNLEDAQICTTLGLHSSVPIFSQ